MRLTLRRAMLALVATAALTALVTAWLGRVRSESDIGIGEGERLIIRHRWFRVWVEVIRWDEPGRPLLCRTFPESSSITMRERIIVVRSEGRSWRIEKMDGAWTCGETAPVTDLE